MASPTANASTAVKYKNQKAGQFRKNLDIGKYVITANTWKLKCLKAMGTQRAKWVHA
jgi:hypothetical protein